MKELETVFKKALLGLILLAIIMILVIFVIHLLTLKSSIQNVESGIIQNLESGIIQNLISMQSITLAITGISITVVSIVISLLSIYREKKIEEANQLIEDLKKKIDTLQDSSRQQQEKLNENLKKMINLLALQSSEYSEQYFDNILNCIENIDVDQLEDTIKTQMSFVMVNTVEKIYNVSSRQARFKLKDDISMEAYKKLLLYSQYMLDDKVLKTQNHELYEFALLKYTFYLYQMARIEERTNVANAHTNLKNAYEIIPQLTKMKDTNGYIHNLCGTICIWLAKTKESKINDNKKLSLFIEAQKFIEHALTKDHNFIFSNNRAIVLMNIAYEYKKRANWSLAYQYLNEAKTELQHTLQYNENYHFPYNNLANINRNLIEIMIKIKDFYEDYAQITFKNITKSEKEKIKHYIDEGESYLKKSIKIEPNFLDNYYNSATFYLYSYLLSSKKIANLLKKAKQMLQKAKEINPKSIKMLRIEEIIYKMDK